jgi:hypothetical protein
MRLLDHPGVTKVAIGVRLTLPDPNVRTILSVETTVPLQKNKMVMIKLLSTP